LGASLVLKKTSVALMTLVSLSSQTLLWVYIKLVTI
jgi:hypothetical protein